MEKIKDLFMRRKRLIIIILVLLVFVLIIIFKISGNRESRISYSELVSYIENKKVESIILDYNGKKAEVKLKNEFKTSIVLVPEIGAIIELLTESELKGNHIEFEMKDEPFSVWNIVELLIRFGIPIGIIIYLYKNSPLNYNGKKDNKYIDEQTNITVRFSDIAGIDAQKEELIEVIDFLKNPKKYKAIGAKVPKGVLLAGEPGTGKTLLAKAIAGESNVTFFNMSGSEFEEMFVGLGASRVRKLFEEARKKAPSVIFIDEIDAIGGKRDNENNYSEQTLNQILVEMDGFKDDDVIIIAATNREHALDKALLRPGRFDRKIYIPKPDLRGRKKILEIHSSKIKLSSDVDLNEIASKTAGYAGAELANIINESAIIAVRNSHDEVLQSDINEAIRKQMLGVANKDRVISDKEKKLVSYHEAGHAIVSTLLKSTSKIVEISIISRGYAGGYTMYEDSDYYLKYLSKKECLIEISSLLAGRVAEKIVFNDVSSGASNDIEHATDIANLMVTKYGMSDEIGPIDLSNDKLYSLDNPSYIEIKNIINNCEKRAEEVLNNNIELLHKVAKYLIENETISGDEFKELITKMK